MNRIVLDTNVLVAGVLSEHGPPGWIVDLVAAEEIVVVYDSRILAEYQDVLARRELGLKPARVALLLDTVREAGVLVSARPWPAKLPDPEDEPFLAVAGAARVPLVTGNTRHFPASSRRGVTVQTPREFVDSLREK